MAEHKYGWCQSCGALVYNSPRCHKCDGDVKQFCVDITLVKFRDELKAKTERIKELEGYKEGAKDCLRSAKKRITELEQENNQLLELSENLTEHPEGYDGPCLCQLCKSYG